MTELTLAVAANVDVGVAIASFSGRLSRMYKWNPITDTFEAGQFLKARARVLDLSPDGRYVAYYAEKHGKGAEAYIAVSHVPYFSAMACFLDHYRHWHDAKFSSPNELHVGIWDTHGHWAEAFPEEGRRIDPGCPLMIDVHPFDEKPTASNSLIDPNRNRKLWARGLGLYTGDTVIQKLIEFERAPFEEIVAPGWAQRW